MRLRLGAQDRVWVDGVACEVVRSTRTGHVLRTLGSLREREEIPDEEFTSSYDSGAIEIDRDHFEIAAAPSGRGPPVAMLLADLTEEKAEETLFRTAFVERFNEMREAGRAVRTDDGYAAAAAAIHEERRLEALAAARRNAGRAPRGGRFSTQRTCPSGPQLRRWCEAYSTSGPSSLSPRTDRCGNRTERFHPVVEAMLARTVQQFCSKNQPSRSEIHRRLERLVRTWNRLQQTDFAAPSYSTVCSRIGGLPVIDVEIGRGSAESAQRRLAVSRGGLAPRLLLERVEIDEWRVNLQALLVEAKVWRYFTKEQKKDLAPVRCWITAAVCCTSHCVLSLHLSLDDPSATTAVAGLRQVLVDKTELAKAAGAKTPWNFFGSPMTLGADKGAGFSSLLFQRIVADLRCSKPKPPAGFPNLRGTIERFFGTLDRGLLQFFTGRTFASIAARGDYDAQAMASLTVEELRKAVIRYTCDVYHRRSQKNLGGRSPAQTWDREMAKARVLPPPSRARMRDIFGTHLVRKIEKKGILFAGTYYHSAWLDELWLRNANASVDIRVDGSDLSAISVRAGPNEWISVNSMTGRRFSEADVLAALKLAAVQKPSEFDDDAENLRVMDQALADLADLGETARLEAGISDPVGSPEEIESLRARHRRLWRAHEAKRASRGLDPLDGVEPTAAAHPPKPGGVQIGSIDVAVPRASPPETPLSSHDPVPARAVAGTTTRKNRDPSKPRFQVRS